jgi:2-polyprenyl-3-methyl-5-hydroxy-6-metoxy-1,4-benzoquinol methylase
MMPRRPEPELMDMPDEVDAYARADFRAVNARFVEWVFSMADGRDGLSVLDIGCGPGDIPLAIARAKPGWRVTAVDDSEPMLMVARRRSAGTRNLAFAKGDAKSLPDLGLFDLILSNSLLHHLPEPAGFWSGVKKHLRAEGRVMLRDLRRPTDEATARRIVAEHAGGESGLLQEEFYRSLLSAFTVDEVRQQLIAAGLSALQVGEREDRYLDVWTTDSRA